MNLLIWDCKCDECHRPVSAVVRMTGEAVDICPDCLRAALELRLPSGSFASGFGYRGDADLPRKNAELHEENDRIKLVAADALKTLQGIYA